MTFLNKLVSSRAELIHKFTYRNKRDESVFCYFLVKKEKQKEFRQKLVDRFSVRLEEYGEVIGKCAGEMPTENLITDMMERYGFSRTELLPEFL